MWLPIILLCSAPYAQSCIVITGEQTLNTKEACFEWTNTKARIALNDPRVFQARPFCQILPGSEDKLDT
tara:strand:- start:4642 stop:4848 length:207 start_codon:yes stop_codon:yes gene_type:complete